MAKKKSTFGKLLAFTTTAAAIGGTCYIFRDKIKQSTIYKTACNKFSDVFGTVSDKFCSDDTEDFFFDDEDDDFKDVFSENAEHGREYTSITINAKEESKKDEDSVENEIPENNETPKDIKSSSGNETSKNPENSSDNETSKDIDNSSEHDEKAATFETLPDEELIEVFPKNSISSIPVSGTSDQSKSVSETNTASAKAAGYENDGLSDTSEDSDSLQDQDKLDF